MIWWLAQNTALAALLAIVVFAVCRLARLGPALRHALWLIVLVKLVMPPLVTWPWDVPNPWPAQRASNEAAALGAGEEMEIALTPLPGDDSGAAPAVEWLTANQALLAVMNDESILPGRGKSAFESSIDSGAADSENPDSPPPALALPEWLPPVAFYMWLAGAMAMVLLQIVRLTRLGRLLQLARPGPRWLLRHVRDLGSKMGVRPPQPVVVPGAGSPVVCGLGRPRLLWPAPLLETLPHESRRSVVVHELAHLRRRDHWVGWFLLVADCVWWWNPLFWLIRRQVRFQAELACDAWVVATLPNDRRAYAEALIEVSRLVSVAALPVPAVGMSRGPRQAFSERLTMIMRDCGPCKLPARGCLSLVCLALALLPSWSLAQKPTEEKKTIEVRVIADDGKVTTIPETATPKAAQSKINYADFDMDGFADILLVQADQGGQAERDQRLQGLEKKLEAMLKELRELRAGKATAPTTTIYTTKPTQAVPAPTTGASPYQAKVGEYVRSLQHVAAAQAGQAPFKIVGQAGPDMSAVIKQLEEVAAKNPAAKEALQKAIEALRSSEKTTHYRKVIETGAVPQVTPPPTAAKILFEPARTPGAVVTPAQPFIITTPAQATLPGTAQRRYVTTELRTAGSPAGTNTVMLSRTTYKLENKAKADAFAAFLKEHVKASIMEVKAEGDNLTITTTPETQRAIGELISVAGRQTKTSDASGQLKNLHELLLNKATPGQEHRIELKLDGNQLKKVDPNQRIEFELKVDPKSEKIDLFRKLELKKGEDKKPEEKKPASKP